jgi:hypothetical protein
MTARWLALVVGLAALLGGGCSGIPLPCDVTISALPPGSTLASGDPLPAGLPVIAAPGDFDSSATTILADVNGPTTVNLNLRGDAIDRLGAHTAGHVGEPMAIAVNGRVVAVPMIQGAIQGGEIQVTSGAADAVNVGDAFAGCAR